MQEKVLLAKYQDKQFLLLKRAKINCKARKQVLMKEYNRMRRQILGQRGWQEADKPKPDSRQKQKKTELPRRRRSMSNQHRMMLRYNSSRQWIAIVQRRVGLRVIWGEALQRKSPVSRRVRLVRRSLLQIELSGQRFVHSRGRKTGE